MAYPVKRGSRYDRLMVSHVYNLIIDAVEQETGNKKDTPVEEQDFFYAIGLFDASVVMKFARIVVYTDRSNGKDAARTLKTEDGAKYTIPEPHCSWQELAKAYRSWLATDEAQTDAIDEQIKAANAPPAPRHILPKEMLTEEEIADPNS